MLLPAGIVASVAAWNVIRTVAARRDDVELAEGALVFGVAAGFVGTLAVVAINPPTATVGGVTLTPGPWTAAKWAGRQAIIVGSASTWVLAAIEAALLERERIDVETTLLRVVARGFEDGDRS